MNRIDYELGFAKKASEGFNSADGLGIAMAKKTACNTACNVRHLVSRTKRDACKAKCTSEYNHLINLINSQITPIESVVADALTQQSGAVATATSAVPVATPIIPKRKKMLGGRPVRVLSQAEIDAGLAEEGILVEDDIRAAEDESAGMSMGVKIGIGLAVVALVGGAIWYMKKKK